MKLFFALLLLSMSHNALANFQGFLTLDSQQKLYVEFLPAEKNKPTVVLLNGLTYSTRYWDKFVKELAGNGLGILRYDMKGMGETMLSESLPVNYEIPHSLQVEQLRELLLKLKIKKAHLVGLSYGGGVAVAFGNKYPQMVTSLILMAPFTEPLAAADNWIKMQISATRFWQPWNTATDDELYDFFLRQFVYSTYPGAESSVLENPWKLEAVYRMVQGIRKFIASENTQKIPVNSVHLMIANQDQYIAKNILEKFWDKIPKSKRASRIDISQSEHKIPEAIPAFAAAWVKEILKNPELKNGIHFQGDTKRFQAISGKTLIDLKD